VKAVGLNVFTGIKSINNAQMIPPSFAKASARQAAAGVPDPVGSAGIAGILLMLLIGSSLCP